MDDKKMLNERKRMLKSEWLAAILWALGVVGLALAAGRLV